MLVCGFTIMTVVISIIIGGSLWFYNYDGCNFYIDAGLWFYNYDGFNSYIGTCLWSYNYGGHGTV